MWRTREEREDEEEKDCRGVLLQNESKIAKEKEKALTLPRRKEQREKRQHRKHFFF